MHRSLLLCLLFACGLTRIEHVGDGDAATVDAVLVDGASDLDAIEDVQAADVPDDVALVDAPIVDAPIVDALTGSCMPTFSACPNEAARIETGTPVRFSGALVQGLADDVASACSGEGISDWTFAVTAAEAGLLELRFTSAVRYGIEIRDRGCGGSVQTCSVTNNTQTSLGINEDQTLLIVLEAVTACDVPFDLTVTLLPG